MLLAGYLSLISGGILIAWTNLLFLIVVSTPGIVGLSVDDLSIYIIRPGRDENLIIVLEVQSV